MLRAMTCRSDLSLSPGASDPLTCGAVVPLYLYGAGALPRALVLRSGTAWARCGARTRGLRCARWSCPAPWPAPLVLPPAGQGHTLALLASAFPGPLALGLDLRPTALAHALMQALSLALLHA